MKNKQHSTSDFEDNSVKLFYKMPKKCHYLEWKKPPGNIVLLFASLENVRSVNRPRREWAPSDKSLAVKHWLEKESSYLSPNYSFQAAWAGQTATGWPKLLGKNNWGWDTRSLSLVSALLSAVGFPNLFSDFSSQYLTPYPSIFLEVTGKALWLLGWTHQLYIH